MYERWNMTGQDCIVVYDANGKELPAGKKIIPEGHVTCIAFAADGRVAVGHSRNGPSPRNSVIIFSGVASHHRHDSWPVSEGYVRCLAFGADGVLAVGYSRDAGDVDLGGVDLFDQDGSKLTMPVDEGEVRAVAVTNEGRIAAGFTKQEKNGLYNVLDSGIVLLPARGGGKTLLPLNNQARVNCIACGPDGSLAVGYETGTTEGGAAVFPVVKSPSVMKRLKLPDGAVTCLSFAADGRLAVGLKHDADAGRIVVVKPDGELVYPGEFRLMEGTPTSVIFRHDDHVFTSYLVPPSARADEDCGGGVILLNSANNRLESQSYPLREGKPRQLIFGPDGTLAARFVEDKDPRLSTSGVVVFRSDGSRLWRSPPSLAV